jgi:hypothetical protein
MYYFLAAMMDSLYYIRVMVYQFYPSQLNIIIFLSQHPERRIGVPQQNPNLTPGRVQSSIKG